LLLFLKQKNLKYGLHHDVIRMIAEKRGDVALPIVIAEGNASLAGSDGTIMYDRSLQRRTENTRMHNFRDVLSIPSVQKGQRLATIQEPAMGEQGTDVFGNKIPAKAGR